MVSAVPGSLMVCVSESTAIAFLSVELSAATAYLGAFSAGDAARTTVMPLTSSSATTEPARQPQIFVLAKRRLRCIEPSRMCGLGRGGFLVLWRERARGADLRGKCGRPD